MKEKIENFKKRFWKAYFHIKWKIGSWFYYKCPIYINFNIFKPIAIYWKARKVFNKPIIIKHKLNVNENNLGSDYWLLETECNNKWFYLNFHECGWKWKYREVRFESVPWICLIWRNKVKYIWGFEAPLYHESNIYNCYYHSRDNMLYWEGILSYLYEHNKDIIKTYLNNIWGSTYYLNELDDSGKHKSIRKRFTLIHALKPKYANQIIKYELDEYHKKFHEEESE